MRGQTSNTRSLRCISRITARQKTHVVCQQGITYIDTVEFTDTKRQNCILFDLDVLGF